MARPTKYRSHVRTLRNRFDELIYGSGLGFPFVHVSEYPKSGGTWVAAMVRDLRRKTERVSSRYPRVVHHHWPHKDTFRPAIYVVRDGRDVVVSYYFHHVRALRMETGLNKRMRKYFRQVFGAGYDADDIQANLPRFINNLRTRPHGGTLRPARDRRFLSWPDHVRNWLKGNDLCVVYYEQLLSGTTSQILRIAQYLNVELEASQAGAIAQDNSFKAISGRNPGEEDRDSFYRKGIAGDWKNHFTVEAAREFVAYAGDVLVELGYEPDDSWAGIDTNAYKPPAPQGEQYLKRWQRNVT